MDHDAAHIIGTLRETPLHAARKACSARPGDELEASVEGYQIDLRRDAQLLEFQTHNFAALKRKLTQLIERHPVRLVYPIAQEKWIVRLGRDDAIPLTRRKSLKLGRIDQLFTELVSFPELVAHPNFTLEVLMTREEEILRPARRSNGRRASWRRKGWEICDQCLLGIVEQVVLASPPEFHPFLPDTLPQPFTSYDLAAATGPSLNLAQKITYWLRNMRAIESVGKRGRALLYSH